MTSEEDRKAATFRVKDNMARSIGPDEVLKAPPWNGVEPDEVARQLAAQFNGRYIGVLFPDGLNVKVGLIKKCEVDGSGEVILIIDQIFKGMNGEATVCSGSIKLQIKKDLPTDLSKPPYEKDNEILAIPPHHREKVDFIPMKHTPPR